MLYNIFYNVKFIPFYEKIQGKSREMDGMLKTEKRDCIIKKMNTELESHPLFPQTIMNHAGRNINEYHATLEKFSSKTVSSVR